MGYSLINNDPIWGRDKCQVLQDEAGNIKIVVNGPIQTTMSGDQITALAPVAGMVTYNTTTSQFVGYSGSAWVNLGSGATGVAGVAGVAGVTGVLGLTGTTGVQGVKGVTGVQGVTGVA
jgi:hypothetical protein